MTRTILILTLSLCCLAAGSEPKSPAARSAKRNFEFQMKLAEAKRDGAIKRAREEFEREKKQHEAEYKRRLSEALKVALKAANLDEANAIKGQMERADAKFEAYAGKWAVRYTNGAERVYEISAFGQLDATIPDALGDRSAQMKMSSGGAIASLTEGRIERLTLTEDGRMLIEHWNPANMSDPPKLLAIGHRR